MNHATLLAVYIGLFCHVSVHAQFMDQQISVDTSSTTGAILLDGMASPDGGSVMLLKHPSGYSLSKSDTNGNQLWRRSVPGGALGPQAPFAMDFLANGDLAFARFIEEQAPGTIPPFQNSIRVAVARISPSGALISEQEMELATQTTDGVYTSIWMDLEAELSGGCFLSLFLGGSQDGRLVLLHFNDAMTLGWAEQVKAMDLEISSWSFFNHAIKSDGAGGCFVAIEPFSGMNQSLFRLLHFNATGTLTSMKIISYATPPSSVNMKELVANGNGGVTVIGSLQVTPGSFIYTISFDPNGQLLDGHLYGPNIFFPGALHAERLPNGDLDIHSTTADPGEAIIRLDAAGDVLLARTMKHIPVGSEDIYFHPVTMDHLGNELLVTGELVRVDQNFGTTTRIPGTWSTDLSGNECLTEALFVTHDPIPGQLLTVTPVITLTQQTAQISVTTPSSSIAALGSLGSTDMCIGLVGISNVTPSEPASIQMLANPVAQGAPIRVTCETQIVLGLLDAQGRAVRANRIGGAGTMLEIGTDNLAPGLYILTARDLSGGFMGSAKVVVE